ncbi:MAG TPA: hypothetical protein VK631_22025, partial [Solirubrobacteraceae bacterium]|nr:hypothetical protein [Solirubrobacteraceae bacterium]
MPISDEARKAIARVLAGDDAHFPEWQQEAAEVVAELATAGFVAVKLPTVAELDGLLDASFGPHDHAAESCTGCTA